jgi:uncharacterized MnhB-related membrane protein
MLNLLIGIGILVCAFLAIRENRLLVTALWLALTSALVSWMMFRLGAAEVAVVELSVGAGLVTVIFVFAINIAGDEALGSHALLPRPLAWFVVVLAGLLLGWMILPPLQGESYLAMLEQTASLQGYFKQVLWHDRSVDVLLQAVLIFAGVLTVLGLLTNDTFDTQKEQNHDLQSH